MRLLRGSEWIAYRSLAVITWATAVAVFMFGTVDGAEDGHLGRIWRQNASNITAFTLDEVLGCLFWFAIFTLQLFFVIGLFHSKLQLPLPHRSVCNYFSVSNLLHCAFVIFFVNSRFFEAEVHLALNYVNLMVLYIRHPDLPMLAHAAVVSGPLSWTCVALYWNGAMMAPFSLTGFIASNTLIWALLLFGLLFLIAYHDYTMSYFLSALFAAIGNAQVRHQSNVVQCVFPFAIMAILFTLATAVAVFCRRQWKEEDEESAESRGGDAEMVAKEL